MRETWAGQIGWWKKPGKMQNDCWNGRELIERDSDAEGEESVGSWREGNGDSKACVGHGCLVSAFFLRIFSLIVTGIGFFPGRVAFMGGLNFFVIHGFYGRPVKLWSSIKSAFTSFFPLLITVSFIEIIFLGVLLPFALILFIGMNGIQLLGFEINVSSPYFIVLSVILGVVLVFVLLHLQLKWILAQVIVVAESSWGLEPLRRSDYLVKRMKGVALSMLLFFGFFSGLLVITSSFPGEGLHIGKIDSPWKIWPFVVRIVVASALQTVLTLYNFAAFAVLYMDCKAMHGELVLEIAEEFAGAYVSLPFDDGKTPHFVSVAVACT
ncbi:hypothetical protein SADUNF_Sadunf08G0073300 [Salix dunnii]|uniref:Uncharacterized protein n=1 Tax=Salix dunnii TaxID=1413687 RepID=A0A835MXI7_9ROSI|nr:hypothetical protein SADUNF_Sadunf08G0073300 [Salix dunnii]